MLENINTNRVKEAIILIYIVLSVFLFGFSKGTALTKNDESKNSKGIKDN
jgi:hypothetical protein